ncbi:MAG: hypothetical protein COA52_01170 [Hyphomicrobiales bacterium]|nr:MAG: hypothetical protein COA52_00080 [Hyphomicrobiales bacterium]PCJ96848.1 MAG: hypothetical protein COA52_01170 [Hyphomicrobiales bacterium]
MKITLVTITPKDEYEDYGSTHTVELNGSTMMRQSEGIEPEDVRFYRDLSSPHDCETLIKKVIEAVKKGEEIEIEYEERIDEDF